MKKISNITNNGLIEMVLTLRALALDVLLGAGRIFFTSCQVDLLQAGLEIEFQVRQVLDIKYINNPWGFICIIVAIFIFKAI